VRGAQRLDQHRVRSGWRIGRSDDHGTPAVQLHAQRHHQSQHRRVPAIQCERLAVEYAAVHAFGQSRRQQVHRARVDLDAGQQVERVACCGRDQPTQQPGQPRLERRRRSPPDRLLTRRATLPLLQRRRDIIAVGLLAPAILPQNSRASDARLTTPGYIPCIARRRLAMHDISTLCMFVQLKELQRQMAAQRPEPRQPLDARKRSVHGRMLARMLRRFRIVPAAAPAADLEASG
jgi:hypothetical protein